MTAPSRARSHLLDALRGLAAVAVCVGHLRAATLVDMAALNAPSVVDKLLYAISGLGHQAVMVFFVMSGYLVGGSVLQARNRFRWSDYGMARLSRLWTVLVPCLLITWGIDQLVWQCAPDFLAGAGAVRSHSGPVAGQYDASVPTLVGNLLFLQTIVVPVFGSNGPLWSLANEFWYYLLFPLLVVHRWRGGLAMCLIVACLPVDMRYGYLIWLMGAAAVALPVSRTAGRFMWLSVGGVLVATAISKWSGTQPWSIPWGDLGLGLAVAILLWCAVVPAAGLRAPRWVAIGIERLSDMSFSLYLSHFPFVMLIARVRQLTT